MGLFSREEEDNKHGGLDDIDTKDVLELVIDFDQCVVVRGVSKDEYSSSPMVSMMRSSLATLCVTRSQPMFLSSFKV